MKIMLKLVLKNVWLMLSNICITIIYTYRFYLNFTFVLDTEGKIFENRLS